MPKFKEVLPLRRLCSEKVANGLHESLVFLDSIWKPPPLVSPGSSNASSPSTSPIGNSLATRGILPPIIEVNRTDPYTVEALRDWLFQMPIFLVEDVVQEVLNKIENIVHEDKDCKLILTLINIDKTKPSDFFFGVHSLIRTLANSKISKIPFSTRTWFSVWEFEQLTQCQHLLRVMIDSFPLMTALRQINLAYIATDKLLYLLSKFCVHLEELNIDHCQITDKAMKYLGGSRSNPSTAESSLDVTAGHAGCKRLRYLSLQGCSGITDQGIWYLLMHARKLQILRYHQSYSVAEILCYEVRKYEERKQTLPSLALQTFDHPFPYGLNIPDEEIYKVATVCPDVSILNLVSLDKALASFSYFTNLTKATIEMEDAFGLGLCKFMQTRGHQLKEFTISCGSDADSTFLDGGGRSFQLFNVGLKLARRFCPALTMLSISGCGLVTNELLRHIEENSSIFSPKRSHEPFLTKLQTLILLTYYDVDETPIQTCEEELLFSVLKSKSFFHCITYFAL